MKKQFGFSGETVSISLHSSGCNDIYTFEARNEGKLEMLKVAPREMVAKLLYNGFHGTAILFDGIDTKTQKFFKECAGIR